MTLISKPHQVNRVTIGKKLAKVESLCPAMYRANKCTVFVIIIIKPYQRAC